MVQAGVGHYQVLEVLVCLCTCIRRVASFASSLRVERGPSYWIYCCVHSSGVYELTKCEKMLSGGQVYHNQKQKQVQSLMSRQQMQKRMRWMQSSPKVAATQPIVRPAPKMRLQVLIKCQSHCIRRLGCSSVAYNNSSLMHRDESTQRTWWLMQSQLRA